MLDHSGETALVEIEAELLAVQQELTKRALDNKKYDELAERVQQLMEKKQEALLQKANRAGEQQRIQELMNFLDKQGRKLTEYDEQLVRKLIEKITVYEDKLVVELKAGITVDVGI